MTEFENQGFNDGLRGGQSAMRPRQRYEVEKEELKPRTTFQTKAAAGKDSSPEVYSATSLESCGEKMAWATKQNWTGIVFVCFFVPSFVFGIMNA